ncbi:MAG: winged helix-turn-helix transcriptional regulator [Chitinophagaceae bacterium]|nr:winged helix-turn-helix transcriptional regulator [Chitinophagaceae bacterium]
MKTSESKYRNCLYFTTNALARKTEKLAQQSWKKVNLSPSHGYLLMLALENPGIQPGMISDHLQLTPSTVTRLIEKLEQNKLLVRITEGKTSSVYPTSKAKALMPKMMECVQEFSENYNQLLGKEEAEKMVQRIGKMADKIAE